MLSEELLAAIEPWPHWVSPCNRYACVNADCLEVLPVLPRGEFTSVVADPPYGIGFAHGGGGGCLAESTRFAHQAIAGDSTPFDPSPWLRFPSVVLWGANHYADKLPPCGRWLVWDKRDGMASNDQADCELAWTNSKSPARLFSHKWNGMIRDGEESHRQRVHPMQKPVALMRWCLRFTEGTTLDPYAGSGTTLVACMRLGDRDCLAVELDPSHYATSCKRAQDELGRHPLFAEQERLEQRELI